MKKVSLDSAIKENNIFKCPDCPRRFGKIEELYKHVEEYHSDLIPDDNTIKQYIFNRKYKKTKGSCVIDKKETKWNEDRGKYERYCCSKCEHTAREQFKKNCKRKLGTDNPASTPEHQMKTIAGRSYSGTYTFTDGGVIGYSSSYEKDFLEFLDKDMLFPSSEVEQCELIFYFNYDGKRRFHIPDYILRSYNLIVQIKTFKNMNSHLQTTGRDRQLLSDKAIIDSGGYNYIVILDKDYIDFINMIKILKNKALSDVNRDEVIISIPKY